MILYWVLINILYVWFRVFFRRIYIIHLENVPRRTPVLLAPNHPNSFIDGTILSVILRRKLNLLVRGDVFNHPVANRVLRSMRLLPIYRASDTSENQDQSELNNRTYDQCYRIFKKRGMVLIFPEGNCVTERRLRSMKKGMARMAFETIELHPDLDLHIVPVGLNYSNPGRFREELCINFGKAIPVQEYMDMIREGKAARAQVELNDRVYEALEREMVIIKDPAHDEVGNKYLEMARNHYKPSFFGFFKYRKKRFLAEKRAANDLNHLAEDNPEQFRQFEKKISDYYHDLKLIGIRDHYLSLVAYEKILYLLFTVVFAIPALTGYLLNFLPPLIARNLTTRKVKKIEFFDSVHFGINMVLGIIYFWLIVLILVPFFGWKGFFLAIGIRLLGYLYLFWKEAAIYTWEWSRILFTARGRNLIKTLRSQRNFILHYFG